MPKIANIPPLPANLLDAIETIPAPAEPEAPVAQIETKEFATFDLTPAYIESVLKKAVGAPDYAAVLFDIRADATLEGAMVTWEKMG